MIYNYETEDGKTKLLSYPMEKFASYVVFDADDSTIITESFDKDVVPDWTPTQYLYQKMISVSAGEQRRVSKYPYASVRNAGLIEKGDAEHADVVVRGVPHEDIPIIRNRQHEQNLAKKYGWTID